MYILQSMWNRDRELMARRALLVADAVAHYALAIAVTRFARGRRRTVFTLPMRLFAAAIATGGTGRALRSLVDFPRWRPLTPIADAIHTLAVASTAAVTYSRIESMLAFPVAGVDSLTQVYDRERFHRAVSTALNDLRRGPGSPDVAVVYLDLDRFKSINDTFGHRGGDEVLRTVAARLRDAAAGSAKVGRLGGDEFAMLFTACGEHELQHRLQHLKITLKGPVFVQSSELLVETSVGWAIATRTDDADGLIHRADVAMYAAKQRT